MMKKRIITLTALMSLALVLAGCQANNPQNQTGDKEKTETSKEAKEVKKVYTDTAEFARDVREANDKLTSVHMESNLEFYNQKVAPYQTVEMQSDAIYQDQRVSRTATYIESKTEGKSTGKQAIIIPTDTDVYVSASETEGYQRQTMTQEQRDAFNLNPDYFELLNYLYENADALALEDKGDDYIITIKDQDFSLIETFGKEFNFQAEGFTEDQGQKELTIRFDKKTLFMKHLKASLSFEKDTIYLEIASTTDYSKWNDVKEDDIKAPN